MSNAYARTGVDVEAGYESVRRIRPMIESTFTPGVLGSFGGFGGLFAPDFSGMKRPVLVSGTDGVGTKLKYAFMADKHDTVGIDCVAMCANDVLCAGARPLFFLDYIACGKNLPERIAALVSGVAEGCRQAGAALIGGETAEHPGMMPEEEYDIAGFCVGLADEEDLWTGQTVREGDVLLGLDSSGVHSNGFSLLRKIYPAPAGEWMETLLTPTRIYAGALRDLSERVTVKAAAHITGGGWIENIPRMLPKGLRARMDRRAAPEVFLKIQRDGNLSDTDMYGTYNMGVGMVVCAAPEQAEASGCPVIGRVEAGEGGIVLW
ncbi:MAG: phosphoribosylformylglycinamidine cyclo-ligase [Oscillospiraceae bacterium]|nr:phosphoribosylformylglycinamidine cyclo-ligase [Oscillospiraceae bacterium]